MKYAAYDKDFKLTGWYSKDIHKDIPANTIEVNDENWHKAIAEEHDRVDVKNNITFKKEIGVNELKLFKIKQIKEKYNRIINEDFKSSVTGKILKYSNTMEFQIELLQYITLKSAFLQCKEDGKECIKLHTQKQMKELLKEIVSKKQKNLKEMYKKIEEIYNTNSLTKIKEIS